MLSKKIQVLTAPEFSKNYSFTGYLIYTVKTMQLFYIWLLHFFSVPENVF